MRRGLGLGVGVGLREQPCGEIKATKTDKSNDNGRRETQKWERKKGTREERQMQCKTGVRCSVLCRAKCSTTLVMRFLSSFLLHSGYSRGVV